MARRGIGFVLLIACGPVVGEEGGGSDEGSAGGGTTGSISTSTSTTTDATLSSVTVDTGIDSSTGEPTCAIDPALQWSEDGVQQGPRALAAAGSPSGDILVVGRDDWGNDVDAQIDAFDPSGALAWSKVYAGVNGFGDSAVDVAIADDGSIYVLVVEQIFAVMTEKFGIYDARLVVLRYEPDGDPVWRWEREHASPKMGESYLPEGILEVVGDRVILLEWDDDNPANRIEIGTGGTYVGEVALALDGDTGSIDGRSIARDGDIALLDDQGDHLIAARYAPDGAARWVEIFGDADDDALAVIADVGATYVGLGIENAPDVAVERMLRRYAADGTEEWTVSLGVTSTSATDLFGSIALDGTIVLAGERSVDPAAYGQSGNEPLWTARYAPDGCEIWRFEADFPGPTFNGAGYAVAGTVDGGAFVLADIVGSGSTPWRGLVSD